MFEGKVSHIHSVHTLVSEGFTVINFSVSPEYISKISNIKTQFRKNISYSYCHLFASYVCGPIRKGYGLRVG